MRKILNKKSNLQKSFLFVVISLFMVTGFICDKAVTVTPPLEPVSTGFLFINSIPEGSYIYLNGRNTGRITPDSLTFLDPGNYKVTLKRDYYKDTTLYMDAYNDKKIDTLINYFANPSMFGSLNVTSDPTNSDIFINDSATGFSTPHIFNHLVPGPYTIKCEKTGFRDNAVDGLVFSNETRAFFVELEDTTLWVDYQKSNSNIQSASLSSIDIDNNNIIWIGSIDSGLIKFDGRNFTNYSTFNSSVPSNNILCVKHDSQNKLWVGTDNGIGIFYNNNWSILNKDNSPLPTNRIETIIFENNIAWIGTSGGLAKYNGANWQIYTINNTNLPWHWIKTISIDQLNNKWIGISDSGIASYNDQVFTIYRAGEFNIPTDNPSASAVSANGNIWFGFLPSSNANGGIAIFNGNDWNQVNIGDPQLQVNDIYIDQNDTKWISTNQGFFKMTGQSVEQQFTIYNSKLTSPSVTSSIRDNSGNLWITTLSGGLNKYKGAIN